jgi:AcrR family transcriptional regulator
VVQIKKRAISPQQKALRRAHILAAAAEMFAVLPYEAVKMSALAKAVDITKPALYRYFRGKEVLFLALFEQELGQLIKGFSALHGGDQLGTEIAKLFASHPLYCRLSAILHIVLERDLTYDEALTFKVSLRGKMAEIGRTLAGVIGALTPDELFEKLVQIQHALIGTWHMTHPVGEVKKVLERPDMAPFNQQFEPAFARHISAILRP